jgi:hypothetical protein
VSESFLFAVSGKEGISEDSLDVSGSFMGVKLANSRGWLCFIPCPLNVLCGVRLWKNL